MDIIWFRNDLRVSDNQTLKIACERQNVFGVYCFDPRFFERNAFGFKRTEKFRAKFLIETVNALRASLKQLNISLLVYHEKPEEILPRLVRLHKSKTIYLQKEWTRDEKIIYNTVKSKVGPQTTFEEIYDQFLVHPDEVPYDTVNAIPNVFTQFRKKVESEMNIRRPVSRPDPLPYHNLIANDTHIPNLKALGLQDFETDVRTAFPFKGGENEANRRMQYYLWDSKNLSKYKKTRNGLVGPDYSSKLSAWLANGSLSARTLYWEVARYERDIEKNESTYWLIFELLWRDYFKYIALKYGDKIFRIDGILNRTYNWKRSAKIQEQWVTGTTKKPFVDANMKEIARTGWMSNRGRQNVASYWAKSMHQDWRVGAAYFESMLIDYDVHSNWCNWMYTSGVGNDPRDRIFNIERQAKIYDPQGRFQNLWLQERLF
ncbi:DASH family cryptochrome [Pareuzebyella sediminis]|uniref:DASH family cryptochrome n=1 Tax=Pareuzebyella sediminis TaxID=2607998 RepID=UPI002938FE7E|nr:DASH family cryptochrome [Pareuzebyella sediminis]